MVWYRAWRHKKCRLETLLTLICDFALHQLATAPPARSGHPECLLADAWERLRLLASYNQVRFKPGLLRCLEMCPVVAARAKGVLGESQSYCTLTPPFVNVGHLLQEPTYDFGAVLERAADLGAKRLIICDPGELPLSRPVGAGLPCWHVPEGTACSAPVGCCGGGQERHSGRDAADCMPRLHSPWPSCSPILQLPACLPAQLLPACPTPACQIAACLPAC